jgi:hypothetical protein
MPMARKAICLGFAKDGMGSLTFMDKGSNYSASTIYVCKLSKKNSLILFLEF